MIVAAVLALAVLTAAGRALLRRRVLQHSIAARGRRTVSLALDAGYEPRGESGAAARIR